VQYWTNKIETNRARDVDTNRLLEEAGWAVLRYWEHEEPTQVVARIEQALEESP
jgi:DNA mismatch endonuclease (patch repair protein)